MKTRKQSSKYIILAMISIIASSVVFAQVVIPTGLSNAVQYLTQSIRTSNGTASGTVNVNIHTGGIVIRTGLLNDGTGWNQKALGLDSSGNVVYVDTNMINTPFISLTGYYIPRINSTGDGLEISKIFQSANENIAIGHINPQERLHVHGNIRIDSYNGNPLTYTYTRQAQPVLGQTQIPTQDRCSCDISDTIADCNQPSFTTGGQEGQGLVCIDITAVGPYDYWLYIGQQTNLNNGSFVVSGTRVGIGTLNPITTLDVRGDVMIGVNHTRSSVVQSAIVGGSGNQLIGSTRSIIGGGNGNRISTVTNAAIIGGSGSWIQSSRGMGSIIGGGGNNIVDGPRAGIIGGNNNKNNAENGFIGGGENNTLRGYDSPNPNSRNNAIIGGSSGHISEFVYASIIIGGVNNRMDPTGANGNRSIILGGQDNTMSGTVDSIIWGTTINMLNTTNSIGLGRNITIPNQINNTFVYSNSGIVASPAISNQFLIYSSNGVGINTNQTTGFALSVNGSARRADSNTARDVRSDERLKKNIAHYTKGLNAVLQINPMTFDYNGLGGTSATTGSIGVIAQQIAQILPETVSTYPGEINGIATDIYTFNPHALTFVMINAIKEQQSMIEALQTQITNLTNRITTIESMID